VLTLLCHKVARNCSVWRNVWFVSDFGFSYQSITVYG